MKILILLLAGLCFVVHAPAVQAQETDDLPLKADKTLSFSVDEATWLSVDVDPNASRMVIEVLGDLYLLPMAGGIAEPLSVGMQFDSQPRFSPDGSHIAFLSDRSGSEQLWIMTVADGTTRQLSRASDRTEFVSPAWSPDGAHVVVSQGSFDIGTYELWAYAMDGGSGVQLTKAKPKNDTPRGSRHNALGASYDPQGRYLYYARKAGGFGYNLQLPLWQIVRRDLAYGHEDTLTAAPGSAMRPLVSPDGAQLVYATRHEQQTGLRIRSLETGRERWLAYPVQRDEQESRFSRDLMPGYAFTPDSRALIATRDGRIVRIDIDSGQIDEIPFQVDINKAVAERLEFPYRTGIGPVRARILRDPQVSPDGKHIAFAAFARIHVHNIDTGKTEAVSPVDVVAAYPSWAPEGNRLAYVTWADDGGHIHTVRARAGARSRQLTRAAGFYQYPVWTRDGKRIVALRSSSADRLIRSGGLGAALGADVVWLPARGGEVNEIIPARGMGRPHFGAEADRVYLQASLGPTPGKARTGLISVRFDGSDRRQVLKVSGPGSFNRPDDAGAEMMQISPDGQHVLFVHASQLHVAKLLPHLPGQTIKLQKPQLPVQRLTDVGADFFGWSADGETITWSVGHHIYQRPLSSVVFVALEDGTDDEEAAGFSLAEAHDAVSTLPIDLYLPRYVPQGVVALVNADIITMRDEEVIERGVIIVEGDRISAVGQADEINVPAGARLIDLAGKVVLPGFIDTHAHFRVAREVPTSTNPSLLANLAYGVTTGMDVQPSTVDLLSVQDRIDAGLMLGPRAFSTGPGVFRNHQFKSSEHARAVLSRYAEHYGVHNIKAYVSGSRQQRQWLLQAAKELKLMPTTEGYLDMKIDLTHLIDGFSGLEHNFPLPRLYDDVVQLAAQTRIAYTPTLLVTYGGPHAENFYYATENPLDDAKLRRFTPYHELAARALRRSWFHEKEYVFTEISKSSRKILHAGGQVGIGAHGQLQGLGYHWELWAVASGGFGNHEALRLATIGGAEMLGLAQDLGSLEQGKLADLIVLNENPLVSLRHTTSLEYVMKGGVMHEAETLHQVWPKKQQLPDLWWWHWGPQHLSESGAEE